MAWEDLFKNPGGVVNAPDGTALAPGMTWDLDLDSGFYRIGANNIGLALGGVLKVDFGVTTPIHVKSGDAGAVTAHVNARDVVIEGAGNTGLSILFPDADVGRIVFGSPADNIAGIINYQPTLTKITFGTAVAGGIIDFNTAASVFAATINAAQDVGIGISSSLLARLHVRDSAPTLAFFESTDAGAGAGPAVYLWRNSASPAAGDNIGALIFRGEDSGGAVADYGLIRGELVDPTAGQEDGQIIIEILEDNVSKQLRWGPDTADEGASLFLANTAPAPTTSPASGGLLYVVSGALHFLGSSGTDTTIAVA